MSIPATRSFGQVEKKAVPLAKPHKRIFLLPLNSLLSCTKRLRILVAFYQKAFPKKNAMLREDYGLLEVSVRKEFKRFRKALLVSPEIYGLMSIDSFIDP